MKRKPIQQEQTEGTKEISASRNAGCREAATASDWVVYCAWCKKHLRGPKNALNVSHGICPECAKDFRRQIDELPEIQQKRETKLQEAAC